MKPKADHVVGGGTILTEAAAHYVAVMEKLEGLEFKLEFILPDHEGWRGGEQESSRGGDAASRDFSSLRNSF